MRALKPFNKTETCLVWCGVVTGLTADVACVMGFIWFYSLECSVLYALIVCLSLFVFSPLFSFGAKFIDKNGKKKQRC